tara:strand:+ start:516 stop:887 length:372 start_codon:yes stop_codon:yes gene_type:complete
MQKKLLFEDMTMVANKWTAGISNRELKPRQMSLHDVVDAYNQASREEAATPHTPYPMDDIAKDLGDADLLIDQIQTKLRIAQENPIVQEKDHAILYMDNLINNLEKIKKFILNVGNDLDKHVQ